MPRSGSSRLRALLLPIAAAAALALASCGDDYGGSGDTQSTATGATTAPSGLSVVIEPASASAGSTVQASVRNDTAKQFTYGAAYELEHQVAGGFDPVKLPATPVIEIGYVAPPGKTGPPVEVKLPDGLEPGTYRVVLLRDVPGVGDLAGEFEVSDGA